MGRSMQVFSNSVAVNRRRKVRKIYSRVALEKSVVLLGDLCVVLLGDLCVVLLGDLCVVLLGDLCVAFGVGFGVDAWSGRGGLLMHVLLVSLLPMPSTEKEFERSIGVVLKRDDEKLGMPHWQHSQVMLLWV